MKSKDNGCDCNSVHEHIVNDVKASMPSGGETSAIALLLKVFGDETRVKILSALNCHTMCVCDLAVTLNMTKSAISHQLKVLKKNNLVQYEKKGKHSYYSLADNHVKVILDVAKEHINE